MKLVVVGAGGRMGQALMRAVAEVEGAELVGAVDRAGADVIGTDVADLLTLPKFSGVQVTDDAAAAFANADGVIDFTAPAATVGYAQLAAEAGIVHLIGTTGMSDEDDAKVSQAAQKTTIIKSGNYSFGVNLLAVLVRQAAQALGTDFDIEVLEMHHKHKVDAPSGTALLLGEAAAEGRNISLTENAVMSREGITGERKEGDIGFVTLRGGTVVGSHSVLFAGDGERIEISHVAEDRGLFAKGAVKAALWGQNKQPGLFDMADVLGLPKD